LAIIRAIYEYPKVLILDEGFNAIDLHLEELIFTTLKKYAQKNAVFMVTHNLKTIYKTDYAYILKDKRIIESGPPGELLSRENLFRSFLPPFSWSKNTPKIIK
jgi:ATP-binding cassette subfamily B protein